MSTEPDMAHQMLGLICLALALLALVATPHLIPHARRGTNLLLDALIPRRSQARWGTQTNQQTTHRPEGQTR